MDNEYHNSPPDDRVSAFPPYQLERNRSEMTASPAFSQNGGSAYGPPPPPRTTASPALSTRSDARSDPRKSEERNRSRARSGGRSGSGQVRVCHKCGEQLTGQFVRALDGTFHLDCFKCRDCGQIVASKFFPAEDENGGGQYPLCETDYFRRLGLLCHQCGGALRGSYITALDRKYHVDHFTCTLCSTVFGAQDSYYEHDSNVYCHYHYSTQFAQRCNGCQTAILKQFVEIFRNGQNQHWHPECYMIHKFWNVRLTTPKEAPEPLTEPVSDQDRELIRREEESMEDKVYKIWSVLSTFEESSAACISDMLLHVSNGAYVDGVFVAKKFIVHVEILFKSADRLDETMKGRGMRGLSYGREAKLLCKKIVSFFSLLSKTQDTGVRKLGVTQELLSLVTGLAHYLKLLIRICLQGTLKLEREHHAVEGLHQFLDDLSVLEDIRTDESSLQITLGMSTLSANDSDQCRLCRKPIEDSCALHGDKRWHAACVNCTACGKEHGMPPNEARIHRDGKIYCVECEAQTEEWGQPLERVSKLQQYVFLLKVALARLLEILRNSGALPHTSEDPNLNGYDAMDGHRLSFNRDSVLLRSDSRSKSYADDPERHEREVSYENTLNDVRRLRSTRLDKHLSTSLRKARSSRVMDGPDRGGVRPGSAGANAAGSQSRDLRIDEGRETGLGAGTGQYFGHQEALTLDDIPRIVAAEQAREQQPASYRQSRQEMFRSVPTDPSNGDHRRSHSGGRDQDFRGQGERSPQRGGGQKFFSELSGLEYFIVRHVAVLTMQPLLEAEFTLEELLGLIEARKAPTFWNKFGKAFGTKENKKAVKKKGVFGVPLEVTIERDGADSTDGVGPGALRIPAIVEDIITAMKNKDLSVEGVFRKNGNIKKLTEQVATVDRDGCDAIRFNDESPHQLAALLKRYLRELPDPLMTQKLYRLWTVATKISDPDKRRHCLHLACCLLPQTNRDSLEVLFSFLKWVSTFHQIDEENGSRMDIHNLARVIAPNVLYSTAKSPSFSDEPMVAVSCVEDLIQFIEDMCMVPVELMDILGDSSLFSNSGDITTKEILKRIESRAVSGGVRQYDVEYAGRQDNNRRPLATRVETDPIAWQKESSVRPIQETAFPPAQNPDTPPQKWRNPDYPDDAPDSADKSQRREWRQSAPAGRPPNSVSTGTG